MQIIKLEVNPDELNMIFGALSEGAFKTVAPLINKLHVQVSEQFNPKPAEVPAKPADEPAKSADEPAPVMSVEGGE